MRATLGFGLAVLLVVAAGAAGQEKKDAKKGKGGIDAKKLVGRWEAQNLPLGKAQVEFTKDGKLTVTFTLDGRADKAEGTYKLDGDKLSVDFKDRKDTSTVTKLTDDELSLRHEAGKEESFKRAKGKK